MIDTFSIYSDLKDSFGDEPARKMTQVIGQIYKELSQSVRREDFNDLIDVVKELAEAQKQTEKRLDSLIIKVEELAEAQKQTEKRLDSLTIKVEELAEAQRRTEARVEELVEAQKRTEERVDELAEAQKKTEDELGKLVREHKKTREMLGGLSHAIGYRLEDEAIWTLPGLLERDFGLKVVGSLTREFLEIAPNKHIEVNIWGEAQKNSDHFAVLGEAKTQLKKRDVDKFVKDVEWLKRATGKEIFPVLITYQTSPKVLELAEKKGIKIYFSFELRPDIRSVG